MKNQNFDPECEFLEKICLVSAGILEPGELLPLLGAIGFSFGRLLEHSIRHKVHFVVADVLSREPLAAKVPRRWMDFIKLGMAANKARNDRFAEEACQLLQNLEKSGIQVVARKGVVLESSIYGSRGIRWMNDIDLMAHPGDKDAIARVMLESGYQLGSFDYLNGRIKPHDREYLITYRLNPDHLPRYIKILNDRFVTHAEVDIATTFTWWNSGMEISLPAAFSQAEKGSHADGRNVPSGFSPEFNFLDVVLHFFREAYFESTIKEERDVLLGGFLDILMLHGANRSRFDNGKLGEFSRKRNVEAPVAWVIQHVDQVFGTSLSQTMGLEGKATEGYLQSWRRSGGEIAPWKGSMRDRIHATDRSGIFSC